MEDLVYIQSRFASLNRQVDTSLIGENQYPLLVNGRIRDGLAEPITQAVELSGLPAGKYQGIKAAANFLVVFIDGLAYYKDFNFPNSAFNQVVGFQLSAAADVIYTALVPESYVNYTRQSADGKPNGAITLAATPLNFSPQALVCQDGVSQPCLIFNTGIGRLAKNYDQWTAVDREFVPIGKQMLYYNGKLYLVAADGNRIYASVTGRPLDFMVIVDQNGDKFPVEIGNPDNIAFRVNFDKITAISEISSVSNEFLVCTERSSTLVRPTDVLQFGEPVNTYQFLFSTGAKNQFSIVDILGDTAIIDFAGIKSFNSIMQVKVEGKNSAFSAIINKFFQGLQQDVCAAINFDNYALFAVNTVYGQAVVVFDTIAKVFVGIDLFQQGFTIKQFAEVITTAARKLYCVTTDNKVFELYSTSSEVEQVGIYVGDFCSRQPRIEQKPRAIKLIFLNVQESGTVFAYPFSDGKQASVVRKDLTAQEIPNIVPYSLPFGVSSEDTVKNLFFDLPDVPQCWKFGVFIQWQFRASLSFVQINCGPINIANSIEQSANERSYIINDRPIIDGFTPTFGGIGVIVTIVGAGLLRVQKLYMNNVEVAITAKSESAITFVVPQLSAGSYTLKLQVANGFAYSDSGFIVV